MNEAAIRMICEYIHELQPDKHVGDSLYEELCVMEWAASEILDCVLNRPNVPAAITVEQFMIRMDMFHYAAEKSSNRILFELARDTADDIGTMLI